MFTFKWLIKFLFLLGWIPGFKLVTYAGLGRSPVKRGGNAEENWDGSYGWHGEPVGATNGVSQPDMGMDQYLWKYLFLGGWTSINPSYFYVNYRGTIGFDTLPYLQNPFLRKKFESDRDESETWPDQPDVFFELKRCRVPFIWGQPHLQPFNLIVPKFGLFPFRWPWLHWGYLHSSMWKIHQECRSIQPNQPWF